MAVAEALPHNRILAGLPPKERERLLPLLEVHRLYLGDVLQNHGDRIPFLHFPIEAAISMTNLLDEQHMVEVAVTGREGCSGSSIVQGSDRAPCSAIIQIPSAAVRVPTPRVVEALPQLPYVRAALDLYNFMLLRHSVISVGCSQYHPPAERLPRWLMAHWHRTGLEIFPFTTEFLAAQVGVERTTTAEVLGDLQDQGLIKKSPQSITITDHEALEWRACACFGFAREATEEYGRKLDELIRTSGRA